MVVRFPRDSATCKYGRDSVVNAPVEHWMCQSLGSRFGFKVLILARGGSEVGNRWPPKSDGVVEQGQKRLRPGVATCQSCCSRRISAEIRLWETAGRPLKVFRGESNTTNVAHLNPNDRFILVSSNLVLVFTRARSAHPWTRFSTSLNGVVTRQLSAVERQI